MDEKKGKNTRKIEHEKVNRRYGKSIQKCLFSK
jgi:hypothetical protein